MISDRKFDWEKANLAKVPLRPLVPLVKHALQIARGFGSLPLAFRRRRVVILSDSGGCGWFIATARVIVGRGRCQMRVRPIGAN